MYRYDEKGVVRNNLTRDILPTDQPVGVHEAVTELTYWEETL